jgi:hypothetical protein
MSLSPCREMGFISSGVGVGGERIVGIISKFELGANDVSLGLEMISSAGGTKRRGCPRDRSAAGSGRAARGWRRVGCELQGQGQGQGVETVEDVVAPVVVRLEVVDVGTGTGAGAGLTYIAVAGSTGEVDNGMRSSTTAAEAEAEVGAGTSSSPSPSWSASSSSLDAGVRVTVSASTACRPGGHSSGRATRAAAEAGSVMETGAARTGERRGGEEAGEVGEVAVGGGVCVRDEGRDRGLTHGPRRWCCCCCCCCSVRCC